MIGVLCSAATGDSTDKEICIPVALTKSGYVGGVSGLSTASDNRIMTCRLNYSQSAKTLAYDTLNMLYFDADANLSYKTGRKLNGIVGLIRR